MATRRLTPTDCRWCGHDWVHHRPANTDTGPVPCTHCDTGVCDEPRLDKVL